MPRACTLPGHWARDCPTKGGGGGGGRGGYGRGGGRGQLGGGPGQSFASRFGREGGGGGSSGFGGGGGGSKSGTCYKCGMPGGWLCGPATGAEAARGVKIL